MQRVKTKNIILSIIGNETGISEREGTMMKNRKVAYVVMTLALAVAVFLAWLLLLPAINLQDPLFWTFVVGTLFIWGILASAIEGSFGGRRREDYKAAGIAVACGVGIAAVGLLIALASSVVFQDRKSVV